MRKLGQCPIRHGPVTLYCKDGFRELVHEDVSEKPLAFGSQWNSSLPVERRSGRRFFPLKEASKEISMARFFLPMAFSATLMMSTHFFMSRALSGTSLPEVSFAAYGAAISLGGIFDCTAQTLRQVIVANTNNVETFKKVKKISFVILAGLVSIMAVIDFAFPELVFSGLLDIPSELLPEVKRAFFVLTLLPVVSTFRAIGHSALILTRKTEYMARAMVVRVALMAVAAYLIDATGILDGGTRGAAMLVFGIGVEATGVYIAGDRVLKGKNSFLPLTGDVPDTKSMISSFVPLASAGILLSCTGPIITCCLSRTQTPSTALGAYQVAAEFAYLFNSSVQVLHQVVLVYGIDAETSRKARQFSLMYGASVSIVMGFVNLTGLSRYVMRNIIGVPAHLVEPAVTTLWIFSGFPLIYAFGECGLGRLLRALANEGVVLGRLAGVFSALVLSWVLSFLVPSRISGAWLGALVLGGAGIVDATLMLLSGNKVMEKTKVSLPG